MCYEFRLHQFPIFMALQVKQGRFDANWNYICGNPIPVFEQRRSVGGVATSEKTSVLSFFDLDYAKNLCTILGYQHVLYFYTHFSGYFETHRPTVHIMHRQYTDPFWEIYPDFDCDSSGNVGMKCMSKF